MRNGRVMKGLTSPVIMLRQPHRWSHYVRAAVRFNCNPPWRWPATKKTTNESQVSSMLTAILKILALLTSLATTILVIVASVRQGLIIAWTIFGVVKIIFVVLFVALILLFIYF